MEHYRPAVGGIEYEAAASRFAESLFLFADYIVAFDCPRPARQICDDLLMGLICAEHVFMAGPGEAAEAWMQIREDPGIGRHFPERDIGVDSLAQVFQHAVVSLRIRTYRGKVSRQRNSRMFQRKV